MNQAVGLTARQIDLSCDEGTGGFCDTAGNQEHLLVRSKEFYGGARPSGSAPALTNLVEFHEATDEGRYQQLAEES